MMSVTANSVTGGLGNEITSGKLEAQTISESVDWTPYKQFYVHGDVSLAYNYLQTAYPVVIGEYRELRRRALRQRQQ